MVRGQGTEFDSLREYVDRRRRPRRSTGAPPPGAADVVVRTWRPERDRRVLLVLDSGRTSAARVGDAPRLDAAMDAALLLAALAARAGDRVDLLAYDRAVRGPGRRRAAARAAAGAGQRDGAARAGAGRDRLRRAWWRTVLARLTPARLVVLLTALDTAPVEEGLLPRARPRWRARHQVVLASVADPRVEAMRDGRAAPPAVYDAAAAERAGLERAAVAVPAAPARRRGGRRPARRPGARAWPTATSRSRPPAGSERSVGRVGRFPAVTDLLTRAHLNRALLARQHLLERRSGSGDRDGRPPGGAPGAERVVAVRRAVEPRRGVPHGGARRGVLGPQGHPDRGHAQHDPPRHRGRRPAPARPDRPAARQGPAGQRPARRRAAHGRRRRGHRRRPRPRRGGAARDHRARPAPRASAGRTSPRARSPTPPAARSPWSRCRRGACGAGPVRRRGRPRGRGSARSRPPRLPTWPTRTCSPSSRSGSSGATSARSARRPSRTCRTGRASPGCGRWWTASTWSGTAPTRPRVPCASARSSTCPGCAAARPGRPAPVRFLADYDNVLLGHADRTRIISPEHRPYLASPNGVVPATFLLDGRVAGTWDVPRDPKHARTGDAHRAAVRASDGRPSATSSRRRPRRSSRSWPSTADERRVVVVDPDRSQPAVAST